MDPTYIGLAGFLTLALSLVTISNSDDSDVSDDDTPDEPVLSDDGLTLTGTDGDDILAPEGNHWDSTGPSTILGGAGDDLIEGNVLEIQAGEGDDTLNLATGYNGHYHGGDGDDLIVVEDADGASIYGDDGNDTIEVDHWGGNSPVNVTGGDGDGDDLISIRGGIDAENYLASSPAVELGEGEDTINWNLPLVSGGSFYSESNGSSNGSIGQIADFNSEEDVLNINFQSVNGVYQGFEISEHPSGTELDFLFLVDDLDERLEPTGNTWVARASISMPNTFGVSADAINITVPQ